MIMVRQYSGHFPDVSSVSDVSVSGVEDRFIFVAEGEKCVKILIGATMIQILKTGIF